MHYHNFILSITIWNLWIDWTAQDDPVKRMPFHGSNVGLNGGLTCDSYWTTKVCCRKYLQGFFHFWTLTEMDFFTYFKQILKQTLLLIRYFGKFKKIFQITQLNSVNFVLVLHQFLVKPPLKVRQIQPNFCLTKRKLSSHFTWRNCRKILE